MKTETIMNTLIQNSTQFFISIQDQNILNPNFSCRYGRRKSCRAAANNYYIVCFLLQLILIRSCDNLGFSAGFRDL